SLLWTAELFRLAAHTHQPLRRSSRGARARCEERAVVAVSRGLRFVIGAFNTIAAAGVAAYSSALPVTFIRQPDLAFHVTTSWLAALAAFAATLAIAFDVAIVAWIAIGYLVWIALLAGHALSLIYLALAVSLAP